MAEEMTELFYGVIYMSESGDRAVIKKRYDAHVNVWLIDKGFTMEFSYAAFKRMFPYTTEDEEDFKEYVEFEQ